jgi:hypothetical protein
VGLNPNGLYSLCRFQADLQQAKLEKARVEAEREAEEKKAAKAANKVRLCDVLNEFYNAEPFPCYKAPHPLLLTGYYSEVPFVLFFC